MRKWYISFVVFFFFLLGVLPAQQPIFEENFDYPAGTNLTNYGWVNHSGSGSFIQVTAPGLTYSGYPSSGIGNAVDVVSGSGSREDVHHSFPSQNSGSVFVAFMVNVSTASEAGEYFFHFSEDPLSTSFFRGKVFAQRDASNNLAFGIAKGNNVDVVYSGHNYSLNITYLIVMEYVMNSGTTDDEVRLWINPDLSVSPPTPDVTQTDGSADPSNLGTVALRQSGTNGPVLRIDGIRVGTTWESLSGSTVSSPVISNVLVEPFPANQSFDITCDVTIASGTIDSVKLYFYLDLNQATMDSLLMTSVAGDQYSATLSPLANGTSLIYRIKAWGNNVSSVSSQFRVLIGVPDLGTFHTQLDPDGLPLHLDHIARLRGIVTAATGIFAPAHYDFYMQDNTGGINIFSFDPLTVNYAEGDSLEVVGTIDHYNGKVEIVDFQITLISSGNPAPAPLDVNIEDMGEEYEGRLISIDNVSLAAGSGPWITTPPDTSFNVTITDGTGELLMRIVGSTDIGGNPEPTWPITVIGIGSQYDFSSPYTEGYQILPRYASDLGITDISQTAPLILHYSLQQNYPNPFNPVTVIAYQLPRAGDVELTVYDILGRVVHEWRGFKAAGTHHYTLDGRQLTTGIYFYQLKSGDFRSVKKMVLAR
ncbi:MAG: hypothetical protein Kow0042_11650 [Calditrichia bacterium]